MESSNDNDQRTIALGMPPLPPTSERMTGQGSQKPNIDPQKLKRKLANRRHAKTHHLKRISRIIELEQTKQCLEGDMERNSVQINYLKRHNDLLLGENGELKQKLGFRSLEIEFKEAEYVELKRQKDKLKELYVEQQQKYVELVKCNIENVQFMDKNQLGCPTC